MAHVMEKLFEFSHFPQWISKLHYDNTTLGKAYAMLDGSVYIYDINMRKCITYLKDIHKATVTGCIWYEKSQFYVTCCTGGLVKCYKIIHKVSSDTKSNDEEMKVSESALLHTFTVHTKAVTSIALHPEIPGLMLSASLDHTIRVLNLEKLEQLFVVHLSSGITNMKILNRAGFKGFLFTQEEGNFRLWSTVSTTKYFCIANSAVAQLEYVENLQMRASYGGGVGGIY